MTRRPVIRGARFFLAHTPGLVQHGSKPTRDLAQDPSRWEQMRESLRSYQAALAYPPNRVFLGQLAPDDLTPLPRPWWRTEPAGSGNVPLTNYEMIGGLAVLTGQLSAPEIPAFIEMHGLPGFAPTQGHVASAVPYLAQAVDGLRSGALGTTLFLAKGSLFLGRMTQMSDGLSFVLERNGSAGG